MKQGITFIICLMLLSCKSLSPYFKQSDLAKNGRDLNFGKDKLKLKEIKASVISDNGIGLYKFSYKRNINDEVLLPVLRFADTYYLYKENNQYADSILKNFQIEYGELFKEDQLNSIKRQFTNGIMYVGHR